MVCRYSYGKPVHGTVELRMGVVGATSITLFNRTYQGTVSTGGLAAGQMGWQMGWLVGWLVGWFVGWLASRLAGGLASGWAGGLASGLAG